MKKIFFLLALLLLLFLGFKFYSWWRRVAWDKEGRINFVIQTKSVLVLSLIFSEDKLLILSIPNGIDVEAIHGYGPYRIESVFKLGELEKRGGEFLQDSIQEFLGLPLDGYLVTDNDWEFKVEDKKKLVGKRQQTNLNHWDLVQLWWQMKKISDSKVTMIELEPGSTSWEIDEIIGQFFQDKKLTSEDLAIAVLNATERSGLAYRGAKLISNIGGRVVEVGGWEENKGNCELRGKKKYLKSYTAQKIKKIFDCQWGGEDLADHRADLVVILGEAYWRKLNEK